MSDWYAFDIHGAATMRVEKSAPTSALLHDMFEPFLCADSGDADLASNVRALSIISRVEEEASQQRALLSFAFTQGSFAPGVLPAVTTAQAQTTDNIAQFQAAATAQQSSLYTTTVSGSLVDFANQYEQTAIVTKGGNLTDTGITTEEWSGAMTGKIDAIRKVEQKLVGASVSRASELRRNAIVDSIIIGAAVILVLGLALVLTTLVGRSMVRPLRRLRAGALEIAGLQLPETVRRMSESDGSAVPLTVAPIDVDSTDEIGEVARAFDQVHREAVRLAAARNYRALRESPYWRMHNALIATVGSSPAGEARDKIAVALEHAQFQSRVSMLGLFGYLGTALGLRARDPGRSIAHLTLAGGQLIQSLALRHLLAQAALPRTSEAADTDRLLNCAMPGPGITGEPADWTLAAFGYLAIMDAFTELDPGFIPRDSPP